MRDLPGLGCLGSAQQGQGLDFPRPVVGQLVGDRFPRPPGRRGLAVPAARLKPDGVAVINDYAIKSTTIASGAETYPDGCIEAMEKVFRTIAVPASEIALDLGNARCMNVVLFGAMCDSLGCPQIDWEQVVADTVPEKVRELNIRAFRAGREAAQRCR